MVVTRPEPAAARTAARLRERGHAALVAPVLAFEALAEADIPDGSADALAVTSANAIRAIRGDQRDGTLRGLPLFAVGERTAEAARQAGFANVREAEGDAVALARLLARELKPGARVLHLAAENRAKDLGTLLTGSGISVTAIALYRMRPADRLSETAAAAISGGRVGAVLHYSPRSAEIFRRLIEREGLVNAALTARHLCLSAAVAAPLRAMGANLQFAARPDEDTLLDLLGG